MLKYLILLCFISKPLLADEISELAAVLQEKSSALDGLEAQKSALEKEKAAQLESLYGVDIYASRLRQLKDSHAWAVKNFEMDLIPAKEKINAQIEGLQVFLKNKEPIDWDNLSSFRQEEYQSYRSLCDLDGRYYFYKAYGHLTKQKIASDELVSYVSTIRLPSAYGARRESDLTKLKAYQSKLMEYQSGFSYLMNILTIIDGVCGNPLLTAKYSDSDAGTALDAIQKDADLEWQRLVKDSLVSDPDEKNRPDDIHIDTDPLVFEPIKEPENIIIEMDDTDIKPIAEPENIHIDFLPSKENPGPTWESSPNLDDPFDTGFGSSPCSEDRRFSCTK